MKNTEELFESIMNFWNENKKQYMSIKIKTTQFKETKFIILRECIPTSYTHTFAIEYYKYIGDCIKNLVGWLDINKITGFECGDKRVYFDI